MAVDLVLCDESWVLCGEFEEAFTQRRAGDQVLHLVSQGYRTLQSQALMWRLRVTQRHVVP